MPNRTHARPLASTLILLLAPAAGAQLGVTGTVPAGNALAVPTASAITVSFDANVDATSVDAASFRVIGRWSGIHDGTTVTLGNQVRWEPDLPFFPGEMVTLHLSSALQSTTAQALAGGFTCQFWTRANPGTDEFVLDQITTARLPGEGLIQSYGIHAGDLDRDGSPDFSIPNEQSDDVRVLYNDGCGTFGTPPDIYALPFGSTPSANEAHDFNHDGYLDLAVANISGDTTSVLLSDGSGGYGTVDTYASGLAPRGIAVLDFEGDGDIDVATALRFQSKIALHENLGGGTFGPADLIEANGVGESAVVAVDANGDGLADLYCGNNTSASMSVLLGSGTGSFAVSDTEVAGGNPWMIAAGDLNADGFVDVVSCNSTSSNAGVFLGDGSGGLAAVQNYPTGSICLAIDLGDTDGDGDLDMLSSDFNGASFTYYRNDGSGTFVNPTTLPASQAGSCMLVVDYDRDGDMDLVGVDEFSDELFQWAQASPFPNGIQGDTCSARLRIDNLAGYAGFGPLPPHPVVLGERMFIGITSDPATPFVYGYGLPLQPGVPTGFGLLNMLPAVFLGAGTTDGFGEAQVPVAIPAGLPPGTVVALQGFTLAGGGSTTNPEAISLVP